MSVNRKSTSAMFASGLALCAVAGGAQAGLPAPEVNGVVAISAAAYAVVLKAPGTKYLNPPIFVPGGDGVATAACDAAGFCDFGVGEISATLGPAPQVLLSVTPANDGGGDSSLDLTYDFEYVNPLAPPGATILATVHTMDGIVQTGLSAAQAVMTVDGINGRVYLAYNCLAAAGAAFGCSSSLPNAPFADAQATIVENTAYTVDLNLLVYAHGPVEAQIDPFFTAPTSDGGHFIFSPGVTSGVPEPAAWAGMLLGFGGVGTAMRVRRRSRARGEGFAFSA